MESSQHVKVSSWSSLAMAKYEVERCSKGGGSYISPVALSLTAVNMTLHAVSYVHQSAVLL